MLLHFVNKKRKGEKAMKKFLEKVVLVLAIAFMVYSLIDGGSIVMSFLLVYAIIGETALLLKGNDEKTKNLS